MVWLNSKYRMLNNYFLTIKRMPLLAPGTAPLIKTKFLNYIDINSATLTKMDGTAKGGIVFGLNKELNIPIEFLGIGENIEDLEKFDYNHYINSLLDI